MNEKTIPNSNEAPAMICPVCGKSFQDVHTLAEHMMAHSDEAKKRQEEERRNNIEIQRKHDLENLERLYAEKVSAQKRYEKAYEDYSKKYGGLIFPVPMNNVSFPSFFDKLFF